MVNDLKQLVEAVCPEVIYTHNLADKHDTHVAVALRTIRALREVSKEARPWYLYGCEVWRDLDWLCDADKLVWDVHERENLGMALVGVFDSQISGGKRYDLATQGRWRANATYLASHGVDQSSAVSFGMDLTPLIEDEKLDPAGIHPGLHRPVQKRRESTHGEVRVVHLVLGNSCRSIQRENFETRRRR